MDQIKGKPVLAEVDKFIDPKLAQWPFESHPMVIGISGTQGCGKSLLAHNLKNHIKETYPQLNTIVISIDDLYLTHAQQARLSAFTDNPLLNGRGVPGTHDVHTIYHTLTKLFNREKDFKIPVYDKSAHGGQGDREHESKWITVGSKTVDVVIFEGWFLGFQPIEDQGTFDARVAKSELLQSYDHAFLDEINTRLDEYLKIWTFIDYGIVFGTDNVHNVYKWRLQQEHELIAQRGDGMTDEQVKNFIERYMVVYELYYADFLDHGFRRVKTDGNLKIDLDADRNIVNAQVFDTKIAKIGHSLF